MSVCECGTVMQGSERPKCIRCEQTDKLTGRSGLTARQLEVWIQANLESLYRKIWETQSLFDEGKLFRAGMLFQELKESIIDAKRTTEAWDWERPAG